MFAYSVYVRLFNYPEGFSQIYKVKVKYDPCSYILENLYLLKTAQ